MIGNLEALKMLIKQGPDNVKDAPNGRGETALFLACREGATECVRYLLFECFANNTLMDMLDKSPMQIAYERQHGDIVELLKQVNQATGPPPPPPPPSMYNHKVKYYMQHYIMILPLLLLLLLLLSFLKHIRVLYGLKLHKNNVEFYKKICSYKGHAMPNFFCIEKFIKSEQNWRSFNATKILGL